MPYGPVQWIDHVNTAALPDANDLKKISGVWDVYDAYARSSQEIASPVDGAGMKYRTLDPTFYAGLSHIIPSTPSLFDFSIAVGYACAVPYYQARIIENGVIVYVNGCLVLPGITILGVEIQGGQIVYKLDDTIIYTSLQVPQFPLFAAGGFLYTNYPYIDDAQIDIGVVEKVDYLPLMGVH